MIEVIIPGYRKLTLKHLVMDYNGTMACDGKCFPELNFLLKKLADKLDIHVVTADTFGQARSELSRVNLIDEVNLSILPAENQDNEKFEYIKRLGSKFSVCIGNGRNDRLMLKNAALGIALIQEEGANIKALLSADIICKNIFSALGLLINTKRLIATLRS
jgi:soluble P-type ATPase